ncbi:MAG: hypothetical protein ABIE84_07295, partial [bacterium]
MKILIALLLVTVLTVPSFAFEVQPDKVMHFLAGGFVAGVSLKHGASPTGMVINAALVGAGKESFDYWQKEEWDNF